MSRRYWSWSLLPLVLAWAVSLFLYPRLPEPLPVHWGLEGEPDRYGSRLEALFLLPLVMAFLIPLFGILIRVDPKRPKGVEGVMVGVSWLFLFLHLSILALYLGWSKDPTRPFFWVMGAFFLAFAYFMPRIPPNYFVGVRTPWTLEDPGVWGKVHRASAWGFVFLGLLSWAIALFPGKHGVFLFLLSLVAVGLVLTVYSYRLWKAQPKK